ncbi:hypothetical protein F2Q68_00030904 [Brassica cretica]|uniref:Uncharacterized protein n=1 Tax=Brassica cretica TaxID=69181 RepID=A0A8S9GC15_BRACR|nr:hypothetical protein F2Q68_00030904 [Brassica cretica]
MKSKPHPTFRGTHKDPTQKSPNRSHGRTNRSATDPDTDHRPETRIVRPAEMSWLPADPAEELVVQLVELTLYWPSWSELNLASLSWSSYSFTSSSYRLTHPS